MSNDEEDIFNDFDEQIDLHEYRYNVPFDLLSKQKLNVSRVENSDFEMNVSLDCGTNLIQIPPINHILFQREIGIKAYQQFSIQKRRSINNHYLPNKLVKRIKYNQKPYCGTYSQDGNVFLSACQDQCIRIYNTERNNFKILERFGGIPGKIILDTALSPDGIHFVYSSWTEYVRLYKLKLNSIISFIPLYFQPRNTEHFGVFSVVYSQDGNELLGGCNDDSFYVFNIRTLKRTLKIKAHMADVNAVMFADETSHILFSGSDDGLCKVWDRRTMDESRAIPVGSFSGHISGIIFIDSKQDGRYMLSNSKDQTIKLWDMRKFSSKQDEIATRNEMDRYNWDYRSQNVTQRFANAAHTWDSTSVMTYSGHTVLATFIRARFSPAFITGQRFIYTGSASGHLIIYDVLTGKIISRLKVGNDNSCVRDVSWHPFDNNIVTTCWDNTISKWTYFSLQEDNENTKEIFENKE